MWLALQFPHLGLEVFTAGLPAGPATVLVAEQRVHAVNEAASAAGIVPGSTLATARSICAEIRHFHRDVGKELEQLRFLAEAMYQFSSLVNVEGPDGLILEIGGSRKLFADIDTLTAQAVRTCRSLGFSVRHHVADTPAAALLLARSGVSELASVPLAQAGLADNLAANIVERFANMGIHHVGPLLELPQAELGRRFGPELVDFLDRLCGRAPDPREGIRLAPEFSRQLHLLEPVRDKDALLFPMQRLLNDLEHWLVARQLSAERLRWRFAAQSSLTSDATDLREQSMVVHFSRGQQRKSAFLGITRLRLDQLELPEDVITVTLAAERLQPFTAGSHCLFRTPLDQSGLSAEGASAEGASADLCNELSELVDQLRARLGDRACCGIASREEHVPEAAWEPSWWRQPGKTGRIESGAASSRAGSRSRDGNRDGNINVSQQQRGNSKRRHVKQASALASHDSFTFQDRPRPLWLFEPPRETERSALSLLRGPERIRTFWWRSSVFRDYYVARHQGGAHCWVFVDAHDRWFLHGYFA